MTNPTPTNTPPNSPQDEPRNNWTRKLGQGLQSRSALVIGSVALAIGVAGYAGVRYFFVEKLPPIIESRLGNILNREVDIGEVESFSLTHVTFGPSFVRAAADDGDNLEIEQLRVNFNILPLIFTRSLPLEIVAVEPNLYIEQAADGEWYELNLGPRTGGLPFDLDWRVTVEDGDVTLNPYDQPPLEVDLDGTARYFPTDEQTLIGYDVDAVVAGAPLQLLGETNLETGATESLIRVEQLPLADLVSLATGLPVDVNSGSLSANLEIIIPSFEEIDDTRIEGSLNLRQFQGEVTAIDEPIRAETEIDFFGRRVEVEDTQARLGEIVATVSGGLNWEEGYNLNLNVPPFAWQNLQQTLQFDSPVTVDGQLQANLQITGPISEPIITGKISNQDVIQVEQTRLENVSTYFTTDLNTLTVNNLIVQPTAGGEFIGQGVIKPGLKDTYLTDSEETTEPNQIDWQQVPIEFSFTTELPTEALAQPYYSLPQNLSVGTLLAAGEIDGTLNQPEARVEWEIAEATAANITNIGGEGEILLADNVLRLDDTQLTTDEGTLNVEATGNLETQQLEANLTADQFQLSSILAALPIQFQPESELVLQSGRVNLSGEFDQIAANTINGTADLNLLVGNQGNVALDAEIERGIIQASAIANQVNLTPYLPNLNTPVAIQNGTVNLNGDIQQLLDYQDNPNLTSFDGTLDARLNVADGTVTVESLLDDGIVRADAQASQIGVNQFVPTNLNADINLRQAQVNFNSQLEELLAIRQASDLETLDATFNALLGVNQGEVDVDGNLNGGRVDLEAIATSIGLNQFVPNLNANVDLSQANINLSGQLQQLLTLQQNPNLSTVDATVNASLNVAGGTATVDSSLDNSQIVANITTDGVNPSLFVPNNAQIAALGDDLEAEAQLSGEINPFIQPEVLNALINVDSLSAQLDGQSLEADGNIILSELATNPDVAANLDVDVVSDLEGLPIDQIVAQQNQLSPQDINIGGNARFSGNVQGENLLSAPFAPGNLSLDGNLTLADASLNGVDLDPVVQGPVEFTTGGEIALNLQGQNDVIAASLSPCTEARCRLPYLPNNVDIQIIEPEQTIIADGDRTGDRLDLDVQNFPLGLLNIAPAQAYGISGPIAGQVSGDVNVDLYTLAASGDISVDQPGLGYIQANQLLADFEYNPEEAIARLNQARLEFGDESIYEAQGGINFDTGAIDGQLEVVQGQVEDIITTLQWFDIQSVSRLFRSPDYAEAEAVDELDPVGGERSLSYRLNILQEIEQQIQTAAEQIQAGQIPTELDIRGRYDGQVQIAGTLDSPNVQFEFRGQEWRWRPQQAYADLVPPLGLVKEESQVVPIDQIVVDGSYNNGVVDLEPFRVQIGQALIALTGEIAPGEENNAQFEIANLPVDLLRSFVNIPVDIAGEIDAQGEILGTISEPNIDGTLAFSEAAFNGRAIDETIVTEFAFNDARLNVNTVQPEYIDIEASVPYPPAADNDLATLDVELGTEAIALIETLTGGQIIWVGGEGVLDLEAEARIAIQPSFQLNDLTADGTLLLDQATIESIAYQAEAVTLDGEIDFNSQLIEVESLVAEIGDVQALIGGVIPILNPDISVVNPLAVAIPSQEGGIEDLYEGEIAGDIVVRGAALSPVIEGELLLAGNISIPSRNGEQTEETFASELPEIRATGNVQTPTTRNATTAFNPRLDDFEVVLEELTLQQSAPTPYTFQVAGDLTLSGPLTRPTQLRPDGTLFLQRADIDILSTEFHALRSYENVIVFNPNDGILNPYLDFQLVTEVPEVSDLRIGDANQNEIPDPITSGGAAETIRITLAVEGEASEILPALGQNPEQVCGDVTPALPLPIDTSYSQTQLEQLERCIYVAALETNNSDNRTNSQFIQNPAVTLSSTPPRNDSEIISLLAGQTLAFAEQLQNSNTEQLLEFGLTRYVVEPIIDDWLYAAEGVVIEAGQEVGLDYLRVFPSLEGIYELDQDASLSVIYDYGLGEVRVRYQTKF